MPWIARQRAGHVAIAIMLAAIAIVSGAVLVWTLFLPDPATYGAPWLVRLGASVLAVAAVCAVALLFHHVYVSGSRRRGHESTAGQADDGSRTWQAIVDALPDAVFGLGADGRIVNWNRAAEQMFGYDAREARDADPAMLMAPRWQRHHPVADAFGPLRDTAGPCDLLCVHRDGGRFRVTARACPVPDGEHDGVALSVTLRDSGAQHRAERRAQRYLRGARDARQQADMSNRLKDELLATVSHELRTPLNVIYGWVEVLRHSGDGDLQQQAIDAIDRSARSLSRMVGDILDASSLATGKLRLDPMPVDLARIVADTAGSFRTTAAAAGIQLVTECMFGACMVSGDGERLRQMLSNLLSNAFKFTPEGGRVTVGLSRNGKHAVLTVADTGQGIGPGFLPYVFEAFRRADESPASPRRGLGLGLSIVRHIAELHGGTVAVQSAGRDCGTTFTVTLPAGWRPSGAMMWAVHQQERGGGELTTLDDQYILVVDDDATTRESLTAALTTLGARVEAAASGREALAKIATMWPTVVLSDLAMPDGNGFWLLDAVRRGTIPQMQDVRVLAVTAHADRTAEREALDAGFDGYFCKPVDVQALARTITKVAGHST